ncbi:MAG TPA: hypothetical protein VK864_15740, partial [Longimicrobiales bacterium]|nr:hypothetical protein [Longimicrobiales bacterium]
IRETSTDIGIRHAAIEQLGRQANTAAAAAVREQIAMEPGEPSAHVSSPETAVDQLAHMGDDGRAALRRRYETRAVTNSYARERLERLAKNNFRPIR